MLFPLVGNIMGESVVIVGARLAVRFFNDKPNPIHKSVNLEVSLPCRPMIT